MLSPSTNLLWLFAIWNHLRLPFAPVGNVAATPAEGDIAVPPVGNVAAPIAGGNLAVTPVRNVAAPHVVAGVVANPAAGNVTGPVAGINGVPPLGTGAAVTPARNAGAQLPANHGLRARNPAAHLNQVAIAAGNIGNPVRYLAGNRTRNPDQVDVLDHMNRQMMQGINQLTSLASGLQPSQDDRRRISLESAINSSLDRMVLMTANGIDTAGLRARVLTLQLELDSHLNNMLGM